MPTVKEIVKGNTAEFQYFRAGNLWYQVKYNSVAVSDAPAEVYNVFDFPVPVSDAGEASFHVREKASLLMRYIRKHLALKLENK